MKTIYLIEHKAAYGGDRAPVMAFDNEEEARDYAETLRPCVRGSLEVVPLKFEPARDVAKSVNVAPDFRGALLQMPQPPNMLGQELLP